MGFKILSVTFLPLSISSHLSPSELERIMMIPVIKTLCPICLALAQQWRRGKLGLFSYHNVARPNLEISVGLRLYASEEEEGVLATEGGLHVTVTARA